MNWQAYWKAILSFVSTVVLPGIVMWIQSGQPWPTTTSGWVLWAVTVFGSTATVAAGPANRKVATKSANRVVAGPPTAPTPPEGKHEKP